MAHSTGFNRDYGFWLHSLKYMFKGNVCVIVTHGQDILFKEILVIVLTFYDKTGFIFICIDYN